MVEKELQEKIKTEETYNLLKEDLNIRYSRKPQLLRFLLFVQSSEFSDLQEQQFFQKRF